MIKTESHLDQSVFDTQRADALEILHESMINMRPDHLMRNRMQFVDDEIHLDNRTYPVPDGSRIWIFGSGKAAALMAEAMEDIFGEAIHDGIIICPYGGTGNCEYIQQFEAGHPLPDEHSVAATLEMLDTIKEVKEHDIVFYLLSGGSSSLLCLPAEPLELADIQRTCEIMLKSGMDIHEMNIIRKHISDIKGGQMRRFFEGTTLINLILSDVPGDNMADIGSGPLIKAESTYQDAWNIIEQHALQTRLSYHVINHISRGAKQNRKLSDEAEKMSQTNILLGKAGDLATIVGKYAEKKGYNVWIADKPYTGEAKHVSRTIAGKAVSILSGKDDVSKPALLVHYGESVVHVKGMGIGGRNQELALAASLAFEGQHYITLLSVGTDGKDGETDAAGAISTSNTALVARKNNLEPESFLMNNDSHTFFTEMDSLVKIGHTGNNLMDLQITIINS